MIGYGGMGSWHIKNVQEKLPELFKITGVYDIRESRNAEAKQAGLYAYPTLEALLEDPTVELVTVATPNNFHKPLSISALRAGKNVISEKPVTMNTQELKEVK